MKTSARMVCVLTVSLAAALIALCMAACGAAATTAAEKTNADAVAEPTAIAAEEATPVQQEVQSTWGWEGAAEAPEESAQEISEEPALAAKAETLIDSEQGMDEEQAVPGEAADETQEPEDVIVTAANVTSNGVIDATELFTDRDLTQTPDLAEAEIYTVSDGQDIEITEDGVYVLQGTASDVTVYVDTDKADDAKVQIVLDGVSITNDDFPCIYVREADKVFVTTTDTENTLSVTDAFTADGDTNTDGVIFCRSDLVLSGLGTLTISSTDNGVVCKDDLKITGGSYIIEASSKTLEANDSIVIADGWFTLNAGTDALHAENDDDDALGYIYICGGEFDISAGDDGIHAVSALQIDGGNFYIYAAEGIEGTYIQINDGSIVIDSQDDGINAAWKSGAYDATLEITGGSITVTMASGDTDGIDSNGDLIITGGTIDVTGQSAFDCDGSVTFTGGTVIVNGTEVDSIPIQMMGGRH